jgi:DNA-binding NarL/FixJ family response regulator
MHVLLVDDSTTVRARIAAMLRELDDLTVHEAAETAEALELVKRHVYGVVVVDLHMPGRSGLELLSELKSAAPGALLIVLSNETSEHHRRECLARGATSFLDKSREFSHLPAVIRLLGAARGS